MLGQMVYHLLVGATQLLQVYLCAFDKVFDIQVLVRSVTLIFSADNCSAHLLNFDWQVGDKDCFHSMGHHVAFQNFKPHFWVLELLSEVQQWVDVLCILVVIWHDALSFFM